MRAILERAGEAVDDVTAALLAGLAQLTAHAAEPGPATSAERIDRIAIMEQLRSALAAAQHAEMVAFGRQQVEEQIALVEAGRLDPVALGRGIADQIALACKVSPFHGSRRLGIARALSSDLSEVGELLATGRISERIAETVVSQTSHLDAGQRRLVDKQLAGGGLENLSTRRAESLVKQCAYDADRAAYVTRGRTARKDRRVGLRPAPDTMSVLSGFLPVEQGVARLAALRVHADAVLAAGDERTRDQVMADTLIERVTGQATAADVNVEVGIVMPLESLLDPESGGSAEIVGHGPIPAGIARDLLASTEGNLWWRRPDALSATRAAALARTMARFRVGAAAAADEPLGADYDLATLLGISDVATFAPTAYRRERMTSKRRLRVPIGISSTGTPMELDLKESAEDGMGPHGMCIGATGSGKSELLRTLVLALATTHSSEDLNFVLVDFKGGAAFLGFDQLPHTSAVITNLADELELVDRMQDALTGEMNRRQEHLRAAGNYASRRDYEAARSQGVALEPMPALFVVVDEFSEMLTSKPEFIDVFAMIGRLGRSLGVHLLLASQRLDEGRIHKVETHLSYRIGLRTFSAMESRSVIGVPDAYELPSSPGNGYLRPDTQSLLRFKGAFSSAPYRAGRRRPARDVEQQVVAFGTDYIEPPALPEPEPEPAEETEETRTMLDVLIERLRGVGPRAHQVWLPPLKESPTLDQLLPPLVDHPELGPRPVGDLQTATLTVPVGLLDLPAQQRRELLLADLSGSRGNAAVVGGPQSGKSTMLRTLISGLALTHTAAEVQFYCLDFGGTLGALAALPHVGSIANRLDRDRVTRTVLEMTNLLARREAIFSAHNIDSMASYRRARAEGRFLDEDPYGDVFLVVDGWYTIRQDFDDLEDRFTEIAARGLSFGVHLVVASSRWAEMRPWLRDVLGTRFELRLGDPTDSEINSRFAATVPQIPGRGITPDRLHFLAALPRIDGHGATDDLADATVELAEALAVPGAPTAPQVRLLPGSLTVAELLGPTAPAPEAEMRMALGVEDVELATQWLDFDASPHLLIYGDAETGKTNLLRHIARSIAAHHGPDEARVMFGDVRRELYDAIPQEHQIEYAVGSEALTQSIANAAAVLRGRVPGPEITPSRLHKRDWWTGGRLYILIDDFELVESGMSGGPLEPLLPLLAQGSDIGVHLIIARSTAGAGRSMMNPAIRRMWELGTPALLLSCPKDEGAFLGNLKPRTLPPGRAQFVNRRRSVRLVQTPRTV